MLIERTQAIEVKAGEYVVTADVGSGTVTLSYIVDGLPSRDITDGTFSVDAEKRITLPECELTITLTSDAKASIQSI